MLNETHSDFGCQGTKTNLSEVQTPKKIQCNTSQRESSMLQKDREHSSGRFLRFPLICTDHMSNSSNYKLTDAPVPKARPRSSDKCPSDRKLTLVAAYHPHPDCWKRNEQDPEKSKDVHKRVMKKKASGRMRNSGTHSSVHVSREIWDPSKRQAADAARRRSAWSPGSCLDYKNASWAASQDLRTQRKALLTDPAAHPYTAASLSLSH